MLLLTGLEIGLHGVCAGSSMVKIVDLKTEVPVQEDSGGLGPQIYVIGGPAFYI